MMRERCGDRMGRVYGSGNTFALRGGGRRVTHLSCAVLAFVLAFGFASAMAQPADPPPPVTPDAAHQDTNARAKADITAAREQQRTTAATRQQIQAIRAALRARLAAIHR